MKRASTVLMLLLAAIAVPVNAQVQVGNTSMNLNGTLATGYAADYSNYAGSDHSISGNGAGELSGYYYMPSFLNFDVQPFYGQSRANSSFQSITSSSGVSATTNLFSGTDFPGSISYSKLYNGNGVYGMPGVTNYTTHGDTQTFGINWRMNKDDLPKVNIGFLDNGSQYSIYGISGDGTLNTKMFTINSAYSLSGWNLSGGYQYSHSDSEVPLVVDVGAINASITSGNTLSFSAGHKLPLHGAFSGSVSRAMLHTGDSEDSSSDTTLDSYSTSVSFAPTKRLTAGSSAYFVDNLEGSLYSALVNAGATNPQELVYKSSFNSHSLSLNNFANYDLPFWDMHLQVFDELQRQTFMGAPITSNSVNASTYFSRTILGGQLNTTVGVGHTSISGSNDSQTGLNTLVNYMRSIGKWDFSGAMSYSQATQTLIASYTSSGYNYSGSVGRHFMRRYYWSVNAAGSQSLLTFQPGSNSSTQTYSASLALQKINLSGSYSKANGNSILTSSGLVSLPVPVPILNQAAVVLYNGTSYSASLGASPIRGLTLSGSYAKARSDTLSSLSTSNNDNENIVFLVLYKYRKLNFQAGYTKLTQGFSSSGLPPTMVGSYYFGISRWFSFF